MKKSKKINTEFVRSELVESLNVRMANVVSLGKVFIMCRNVRYGLPIYWTGCHQTGQEAYEAVTSNKEWCNHNRITYASFSACDYHACVSSTMDETQLFDEIKHQFDVHDAEMLLSSLMDKMPIRFYKFITKLSINAIRGSYRPARYMMAQYALGYSDACRKLNSGIPYVMLASYGRHKMLALLMEVPLPELLERINAEFAVELVMES